MASLRLPPSTGSEFWSPMIDEGLAAEAAARGRRRRGCIRHSRRQVVGPEADFVVIAPAVAIFRAVECGRSRMAREQVQRHPADAHRHVPMALRRQRQHGELLAANTSPCGQQARPACRATGTCGRCARARCRSESATAAPCAYWPGKFAEAERVAAAADAAVVIEIEARRHAGVGLAPGSCGRTRCGARPCCGRPR